MINLLPKKNIEKLKKEKSFYVLLLLAIYFIIFLIFLSVTFFVLNEVSRNNLIKEEKNLRLTEDSFEVIERVEAKTEEVNKILHPLNDYYNQQIDVTGVIEKTLHQMPKNSFVESFSFKLKNGKGEVEITGFAKNYQVLLDMEKNLKESFYDVSFDTETWLKINDINFSGTFKIK